MTDHFTKLDWSNRLTARVEMYTVISDQRMRGFTISLVLLCGDCAFFLLGILFDQHYHSFENNYVGLGKLT